MKLLENSLLTESYPVILKKIDVENQDESYECAGSGKFVRSEFHLWNVK